MEASTAPKSPAGRSPLPERYQAALAAVHRRLSHTLGENLWSCVLYGSAVRGDLVEGVSDLNLLLILERSTPEAHAAIAEDIGGPVPVDVFVLTRRGLQRSLRAFAPKFRSIRRHYRVLSGEDPFIGPDEGLVVLRFLAEQALRNLRLRTVHAFITLGADPSRYQRWLLHAQPAVFTHLSEVLRLDGERLPDDLQARMVELEAGYGHAMPVLGELLELKMAPRALAPEEVQRIHRHLFDALDHAVRRVEQRWPV